MSSLKRSIIMLLTLVPFHFLQGQENADGIPLLDALIAAESYTDAHTELKRQLKLLFAENAMDSLSYYPYYVGKISLELGNSKTAILASESFLARLETLGKNERSLYSAYMNLTDFYDEIGDLNRSLKATEKTYALITKVPNATPEEIGKVLYNIGVCHLSLGNVDTSKQYFRKALGLYESYSESTVQNLSDGYNAMGAVMWMSTQLDSAKFYYDEGITVLLNTTKNPTKNLFTATSIRANISLLEQSKGNLTAALHTQKEVITGYDMVIKNTHDTELRENARQNKLIAIYNLSSFYIEIGDMSKGRDLISYAFGLAKKMLDPSDPELPRYQIALGQTELSLLNYEEAISNSKKGLEGFDRIAVHDPLWKAAATSTLAKAHGSLGNTDMAKSYFDQGEAYFKEALGGSFSREYLGFVSDKAFFLVKTGDNAKAIKTIKIGYRYLQEIGEEGNLSLYKSLRDIGKVYYEVGNYEESLKWADKGLHTIRQNQQKFEGQLNTVQINFYKPQLLLTKAKSAYELNKEKSNSFLKKQLALLKDATTLLEDRKVFTSSMADINLLNNEYKAVNDFSKKLYLELYTKTGQKDYLHKLITLQESGIYANIRNKLNMERTVTFADVPKKVIQREKHLKRTLSNALSDPEKPLNLFFNANEDWSTFKDSLRSSHPRYFQMRYASLEESLNNLEHNIPANTTLVRYLFIEDKLYAFVKDINKEEWFALHFDRTNHKIGVLSNYENSVEEISKATTSLYQQLWKPIEGFITTPKVIIFPDQELFNLNFELLSQYPIENHEDFASKSLLVKYDISYNYSLFLLQKNRKTIEYTRDFVAFAPEFDARMKKDYELAISDSINLDKTYLTLLPQPFSADIAERFSKKFNGNSFLNEKASKQLFKQSAKEHKIIHIGTHAESNNVSPELSRLVFAKDVSDSTQINDNYLYTHEIYNQDLSSNLAILTACETGKPTHQPGEGMISLAHAFNYAGSESILTSLWQIDEQSSTQILSYFYGYLEEGISKDKALRKAKLDYLSTAEGRTLHPQYWAGLILMGDTAPIELSSSPNWQVWISLFLLFFILAFLLFRKRKNLR